MCKLKQLPILHRKILKKYLHGQTEGVAWASKMVFKSLLYPPPMAPASGMLCRKAASKNHPVSLFATFDAHIDSS
jgi:hypothetical protein